jgi:hypothetical protein
MPDPLHPRALIRHAVVRTLREAPALSSRLGRRVFPNREEHWLQDELPAAGVYTLSEQTIDSKISPDPDERRIDLVVEILAGMSVRVDDTLDALTLAVEKALLLDSIGDFMGLLINERLAAAGLPPLEKIRRDGRLRWPVDTLLLLGLKDTELAIAVEGDRQIGVASMNFDLEYFWPECPGPLDDFLLGIAGWDVQPHDGHIDMVSRVAFDPAPPVQTPEREEVSDSALEQIDTALKE